jgi:hypothetical protein
MASEPVADVACGVERTRLLANAREVHRPSGDIRLVRFRQLCDDGGAIRRRVSSREQEQYRARRSHCENRHGSHEQGHTDHECLNSCHSKSSGGGKAGSRQKKRF